MEIEIQKQLLEKLRTPETEEPVKVPDINEPPLPGMSPESELEKIKLLDYFEISSLDRKSPEAQTYLQAVVDWARDECGSSDYLDILRTISDQERVLGIKLAPNRLSMLYKFARIRTQRNRLAQEERALYGG